MCTSGFVNTEVRELVVILNMWMKEYIFTAVGRTEWHIDGTFQPAPFAYSLYHTFCVPLKDDTMFAPLNEIVQNLPSAKRNELKDCGWWVMDELDQFIPWYIHILLHKRRWTWKNWYFVLFCDLTIFEPLQLKDFETYKKCTINKPSLFLISSENSSQLPLPLTYSTVV